MDITNVKGNGYKVTNLTQLKNNVVKNDKTGDYRQTKLIKVGITHSTAVAVLVTKLELNQPFLFFIIHLKL